MKPDIRSRACGLILTVVQAAVLAAPASASAANALQRYEGKPLPTFTLSDLAGESHALEDYEGRVLLMNFWATWCAPCVRELPSLERLDQKLNRRRFALLAINLAEESEMLKAFLVQHSVEITVLTDLDGTVARDWGLFAYPTSFLLDTDGNIRRVAYGELEWDAPENIAVIKSLLAESMPEPAPGYSGDAE